MRRKTNKNKYIIILIIIIFFFSMIVFTVNDKRKITFIESLFKDTALFFGKITNYPLNFMTKQVKEYYEKKNLYENYLKLKKEIEDNNNLKNQVDELNYQLKQMQKALDLNNNLIDYDFINATVINRNIGLWYNTITIDRGLKHGVEEEMPVIVSGGLIGIVTKVSNYNSVVKLITSDDNIRKISVKIENNGEYVFGLLSKFDYNTEKFIVEGIDQNILLEKGSQVTTTGLSETLPSGIIIGEVYNVTTDNFGLSTIVEVESNVNFDEITYVTIVKKEVKK